MPGSYRKILTALNLSQESIDISSMDTRFLPNPFRPDFNSLAFFRILAALCFIGNFSVVSTGAAAIFGPFAVSATHGVWAALMLGSALMILAGYRTRFFCLLIWLGLSVPAWLDPSAMHPALIWRSLFFWCLFLPLGVHYSADEALDLDESHEKSPAISAATIGFACHFVLLLFWAPRPLLLVWAAAFLPGEIWPRLKPFFVSTEPSRIFYDGTCGFCKRMTSLLRTFLFLPEGSMRPAQEMPEIAAQMERENSWVVVDARGRMHTKFDAFLTLLPHVHLFAPLAVLLRVQPLEAWGTRAYEHVSNHRGGYSRITSWLSWRPLDLALTRGQTILATAGLIILAGMIVLPGAGLIRFAAALLGFI